MPREYIARLTVNGKVYVIHLDVNHVHPPAVHAALGTRSSLLDVPSGLYQANVY
jgi:hypothetical protein